MGCLPTPSAQMKWSSCRGLRVRPSGSITKVARCRQELSLLVLKVCHRGELRRNALIMQLGIFKICTVMLAIRKLVLKKLVPLQKYTMAWHDSGHGIIIQYLRRGGIRLPLKAFLTTIKLKQSL